MNNWNRIYRPAKVADLALTSVKNTLTEMMSKGNIPQVLLFAGPRGTGKTSSARIVASILNDPNNLSAVEQSLFSKSTSQTQSFSEPNLDNELIKRIRTGNSFVVQELDAASNRGIDEVRRLKEQIFLPPQEGKVSVYILDEVHMLTTEAFNALLKILEETPPHVVFVLATTELHKIPATIISRCTTINFQRANQAELLAVLQRISENEKIKVETDTLELIAEAADGSFRDAVKLLELSVDDQLELKLATVQQKLRSVTNSQVNQLVQALLEKNSVQITQIFADLRSEGADPQFFFKKLLGYLHSQLILSFADDQKPTVSQRIAHFLLTQLEKVELKKDSIIPLLGLELKFLELVFRAQDKQGGGNKEGMRIEEKGKSIKTKNQASSKKESAELKNVTATSPSVLNPQSFALNSDNLSQVSKGDGAKLLNSWEGFVQAVEQRQSAIAMLLRSSKPIAAHDSSLNIEVYYPFHKERLEDMNNLRILSECLQPFAGGNVELEFSLANLPQNEAPTQTDSIAQAPVAQPVTQELVDLAESILM